MVDPAETALRMIQRGDRVPSGLAVQLVRRVRELESLVPDSGGDPCERCGRSKPEPGTAGRPRKYCRLCSPPKTFSGK